VRDVKGKGNDESFASKLLALHSDSPLLDRDKFSGMHFIIQHYAGRVPYFAQGFLEKNRDTLQVRLSGLSLASYEKTDSGRRH
jgi:myosin heavy subunit